MVTSNLANKRYKTLIEKKKVFHIAKSDGTIHSVKVLSLRNPQHRKFIEGELIQDKPVAFHGWGVSGVAKRVDSQASARAFWLYKEGRALGAKVPLLEPPDFTVQHVDWDSVHTDFRFLKDPKELKKLWKSVLPFHIIFPYNKQNHTLHEDVITPPFDPDISPHTSVPTMCVFWIEDPALISLVNKIKKINPDYQIGVSSLNNSHEQPPFNTNELIKYLQNRGIVHYNIVIEDPIAERLDIASSHSQFVVPLVGEKPVWVMKRKGSLSAQAFHEITGFKVEERVDVKVASRRVSAEINLDDKLKKMSWEIKRYHQSILASGLKARPHMV